MKYRRIDLSQKNPKIRVGIRKNLGRRVAETFFQNRDMGGYILSLYFGLNDSIMLSKNHVYGKKDLPKLAKKALIKYVIIKCSNYLSFAPE